MDRTIAWFFAFNGISTIILVLGIFIFLAIIGLQAFAHISPFEFFFSTNWNPTSYVKPSWGILSLVVGTLYIAIFSLIIAVPLGVACAIYLAQIASPTMREILKPAIEMIAALPSVVLGLLGLLILAPLIADIFGLNSGLNALTASILVAIMALPTIISISEDAITSVPKSYSDASLALGANNWQTIRHVIVPAALSGIVAAVMLGLGRVVGETMVVLMVAGNARALPTGFFDPVRPMTATIAIEIKEVVVGDVHYQALYAVGLVLFIMTLAVNFAADIYLHRQEGNK
ncbi:MAG: phosphate ABC transporter permease subunit PstC [ANME-2 cluster archaeon]|nr:phosphate ABC transporter permease subunit PstC [ANME-2 cluster archaeon]MDF1558501.1 phosphate ABC transporter permease subunit PstC [ANME-2 cluster archaeon]